MSTQCSFDSMMFQASGGRQVVACFDGGEMSSDAGVLLLAEVERRTRILHEFARCFMDSRSAGRTEHTVESLVTQRVFGIALGYEDLNDHDHLRKDQLFAVAIGSKDPEGKKRSRERDVGSALAGKSTLNRMELSHVGSVEDDRYKRIAAIEPLIDHFMLSTFLRSCEEEPREIILDVDTTDDPVHGEQEGRYFHGYYGHYCYLPLYIFSGEHIILARLLPGNADAKTDLLPHLGRIVRNIRNKWSGTRIIVRGDAGFMGDAIMSYCEEAGVDYVLGIAKNSVLLKKIRGSMRKAARRYRETGKAVRVFQDVNYRTTRSWGCRRRVVAKAEHIEGGANPRFVVTSISSKERSARWIYEDLYCQRGDMENRIKEQQLDMFSDRTSTGSIAGNQLRLYFSSVAYMLMHALRRLGLTGTEMAKAQCGTIRTKLLKIGALVRVTARKIWVSMPAACPYAEIFRKVHTALLGVPLRN